jgi:beta-lactamase regulating signal transducer with metallopeptidase domain
MNTLLEILLINAGSATLLILPAALLSRYVNRPALVHTVWALILVKLLTPPVVEVATLPSPHSVFAVAPTAAADRAVVASPTGALWALPVGGAGLLPAPQASVRVTDLLVGVWLTGSVLVILLALVRAARFRRLAAHARPAAAGIRERAERLAWRAGLRKCPPLRVIPGRLPPMVWWRLGRSEILLPGELLGRLETAEQDALLAHELLHVRRRDHWMRFIELGACVVFWWYPAVWWIRRKLRVAEERACDVEVLRLTPGRSRAYAEGLLKTLDFLSDRRCAVPALATGAAETRQLKERLTMIMKREIPATLTRFQRWGLALAAAAALLVFPTWSGDAADGASPTEAESSADVESSRGELIELRQRAIELEYQLREVEAQRIELEAEMESARVELESRELQHRSVELEREGMEEQAEAMRRQAEELERQWELEAGRRAAELDFFERAQALELEIRRTALESERRRSAGDAAEARELEARLADLERELEQTAREANRNLADHRRVALHERTAVREREIDRLRAEGRTEEARELELELERMELELHSAARDEHARGATEHIQAKLRSMIEFKEQLAQQGDTAKVAQVEDQIEALSVKLKAAQLQHVSERHAREMAMREAELEALREALDRAEQLEGKDLE